MNYPAAGETLKTTMNKIKWRGALRLAVGAMMLSGCSIDADGPTPDPGVRKSWYAVQTSSDLSDSRKPGNIRLFATFPQGEISTLDSSSEGFGMAGWRPYGNWLMKMFDSNGYAPGIERLKVGQNLRVEQDKFIKTDGAAPGSGNFVVAGDTLGFFWDAGSPLKIQRFNPKTMERIPSGEIDLTDAVNERGEAEAGIVYRAVGEKFLAVKEGKLFANITYAKTNPGQNEGSGDFYPDAHIAVIDMATAAWEKTIKISGSGGIVNRGSSMHSFDNNGDLYLVCHDAEDGSKIARIKNTETEVDSTWSLGAEALVSGTKGELASLFAKQGKLIVSATSAALSHQAGQEDIWVYYVIDAATKSFTKVSGITSVTDPGAALGTVEIDNKIYLRVVSGDMKMNGYYELAGTEAKQTFDVTQGGSVQGIYKINVE